MRLGRVFSFVGLWMQVSRLSWGGCIGGFGVIV